MAEGAKTIWLIICCFINAASSPFLYHVERFPVPRSEIRELLSFNRQYRIKVGQHRELFPDSQMTTIIEKECDVLWLAWDSLDDAKNDLFSEYRRRKALGVLAKTIGPEAFMRGEMPPHVPYWRFQEVR